MLLESHLRLMMSVLCCFSLDVLRPTGAAPMTERSITTEQCPGHRLQIPQIFLHTSDSHLCLNFCDQPMMLRSTRLRQRGCTLVESLITLHSCRYIRAIVVQRENIAKEIFLWHSTIQLFMHFVERNGAKHPPGPTFQNPMHENKTKCINARITF